MVVRAGRYDRGIMRARGLVGKRRRLQRGKRRGRQARLGRVNDKNRLILWKAPNQDPVPQQYVTKLRMDMQTLASITAGQPFTSGAWNTYVLANGLYHPFSSFGSTTGNTPLTGYSSTQAPIGFGSLCNGILYDRYEVLGCKLQVALNPQAIGDAMILTITPSVTSNVPSSVANADAQPWTKRLIYNSAKQTGNNTLSTYVPMAKFLGINKQIYDQDTGNYYSAPYNNNPSTPVYFVLNFQAVDGAQPTSPMPIYVRATWYVRFHGVVTASVS